MRKLFILITLYSFNLTAQTPIEFFKRDEINHPFLKSDDYENGIPPLNPIDSKGRWWTAINNDKEILFTYDSGKDTIKTALSPRRNQLIKYTIYGFIIDEFNTKILLLWGSDIDYYTSEITSDYYVLKLDTLGKVSYLHQQDLGINDNGNTTIPSINSIGGKILMRWDNGKFIWEPSPSTPIMFNTYNRRWISDKSNNLYLISKDYLGLYIFHSDGSYEKQLDGLQVLYHRYDEIDNSITVSTSSGVYKLKGKDIQQLQIPFQNVLLNSSEVRSKTVYKNNQTWDVVMSRKGFFIKNKKITKTYLFSENNAVLSDSLELTSASYNIDILNVQPDSSLTLVYRSNANILYSFSYKDGNVKLLKKYDCKQLNVPYGRPGIYSNSIQTNFYVMSDDSLFFINVKDSVSRFSLNNSNNCRFNYAHMIVEKDYIWINNTDLYDSSKCAIGRIEIEKLNLPLGLEKKEMNKFRIYPNPAFDWINLPDNTQNTIIYDLLGNEKLQSSETKINISSLTNGIYNLKVVNSNNDYYTFKLSVAK